MEKLTPTQQAIQRILWEKWELSDMKYIIDDDEISKQAMMTEDGVPFMTVLSEMTRSFLHQMESSESPRDIISLEKELDLEDQLLVTNHLKNAMQKGTIYLFPSNYQEVIEQHNLPFGVKDLVRKFEDCWMFGLIMPELPNWYFIGHVNRNSQEDTYCTAYKKRTSA